MLNQFFCPFLSSSHWNSKLFVIEVQASNCWIPMNHYSRKVYGYRMLKWRGKHAMIHRLMYELYNGPILNGLFVLHKCDNPSCCNPDHLFLGDHIDNAKDMMKKGRGNPPRGEKCVFAKLTNKEVEEIRFLRQKGVNYKVIAKQYNISDTHVHRIARKDNWKHI